VKHLNVYSQQIYTTTHEKKLVSTQLKSFLPHSGIATRQIIHATAIPSLYLNLEKENNPTNLF
jgi:hypothetical protein